MKTLLFLLLFASTAYSATVSVKWNANQESSLSGYVLHISRDGIQPFPQHIQITKANTFANISTIPTNYTFNNISTGKNYYVAVTAKNVSDLESEYSNVIFFKQPTAPSIQMFINRLPIR